MRGWTLQDLYATPASYVQVIMELMREEAEARQGGLRIDPDAIIEE